MMKHQRLQSCDFGTIKHVGTSIQECSRENYVILLAVKVPQTNFFLMLWSTYLTATFSAVTRRDSIFTSFVLNIKVEIVSFCSCVFC